MEGWTLEYLARVVSEMRDAQKAYYRGRRRGTAAETQARLQKALDLEARVDDLLGDIDARLPLFDRSGVSP